MSRLEAWINEEVESYEREYGFLGDKEPEFRARLAGTLTGVQLRLADEAGVLGNTVLAAFRGHSSRLRDTALARWFRGSR